ncbi:cyclic beta-1,2-glucan synthetase [Papillibacter cinnamivorans DSM 12816]|uniref:Cyclic beta-1,2-glucan synthetase n=2 Tax=Papillibacter TaxID=100175 RepID=A0A1W1ZBG5_9FIRM|nr:cyclic beta-1,2-glucan synthetase [Papillibacter cinnamivorans DSM 12816]
MTEKHMDLTVEGKHLIHFAENTARMQREIGRRSVSSLRRKTADRLKRIRACFERATLFSGKEKRVPGEIEWLLDNWYLAEREGKEASAALRGGGKLPYIAGEEKVPAVFDLAAALVRAAQNELTPERIELFLHASQQARVLSEKELALFVPMLKLALIGALAGLCGELEEVMTGIRRGGEGNPFQAEAAVFRAREAGTAPPKELLELAGRAGERHEKLTRLMGNAFTSLRMLSAENLTEILEGESRVEEILRRDPAGVYGRMDEKSRQWYRQEISRLARKRKITEYEASEMALGLAEEGKGKERHVGYYIFTRPLGDPPKKNTGALYVGGVVFITLFFTLLMGFLLENPWTTVLLLVPVSDIVKNTADFLIVRLTRPRPVVRLELEEGVPREGRTLCVISTLLSKPEAGAHFASLLEQYRFANRDAGENLLFGILADLPDSAEPPEEEPEAVRLAKREIEALNARFGGGFFLFFRKPMLNGRDGRYMGWERKRGALTELMRLLRDEESGLRVISGDAEELRNIRYVITLDSDTRLNVCAARELIGAMLHPLNRPETDESRRIVTGGYGLLQPRISVELEAANRTAFSRIFAGQGGIDPYGSTTSDVYHDLFDEGTYSGKGIIDVDCFLLCLNRRFPENTVLSHDLLEGAYLHAGLIGDIELTDSYPARVTSYFSRLHRWIRGDWQIAPWLLPRVPAGEGQREKNPLTPVTKWKIFDNLRRSLTPVLTLVSLLLGMIFFGEFFAVTSGVAILCALSNLLLSGAELAFRRGAGLRARYHSTIIAGFGGVILQTAVQLVLLPYHAYVAFSAIATALYRMLISRRRLLAWVTSDAEEAAAGKAGENILRKMWASILIGAIAIVFSKYPAGSGVGIVWALSPVFAWKLGRTEPAKQKLGEADRAFLLRQSALIWRYFTDFLTEEDHFLPPDNYQEQPAAGLARRTSPTNMGMALLCCLAAADLELTSRQKALELIGKILTSMEGLERWNGHFYNWYDTRTAQCLCPRCVSTVDSGNLCGCLTVLREGLLEMKDGEARELAQRAEELSAAMRFGVLFDRNRKLFRIGYDIEREKPMDGWYDLMASEARQTSYIAIARGEVEPRHWRRLGRALVSENDYRGMASWTGTMFEYLMPNLLMPCYKNSLIYESARFCVYVHRRRTWGRRIPWGISESAFYAFDGALNYQYKAHGVQKLGFKRGLNRELVISPYSTFLALETAPRSAVRNLRSLREMGMEGKYGMYEAADFTPVRQTGAGRYEIVRCFMVHHLGMSMVALDNALRENTMQRRFMKDGTMAAFSELLQEKVPVGALTIQSALREVPERIKRASGENWRQKGGGYDPWTPRCVLLSNGSYTVLATDTGLTSSVWGENELTRFEPRQTEAPMGMEFYAHLGEERFSLTPAPGFDPSVEYGFHTDGAVFGITGKKGNLTTGVEICVPENENCELREVRLSNGGKEELEGELIVYFEPVLAPRREFEAHPAFSRLALAAEITEGGVLVRRRAWGNREERHLAFLCDAREARFETSREQALGRGGRKKLREGLLDGEGSPGADAADPCVLVRIPLRLKAGGQYQARFALAAGPTGAGAENAARFVLKLPKARTPGRLEIGMRLMRMEPEEVGRAMVILRRMTFLTRNRRRLPGLTNDALQGQRALWAHGISGDLPILAAEIDSQEECRRGLTLAKQYRLLSLCGGASDLVLLIRDGGDYRRPLRSAMLEALRAMGCERLLGARGGIHLLDGSVPGTAELIRGNAAYLAEEREEGEELRDDDPLPPVQEKAYREEAAAEVSQEWLPEGGFSFTVRGRLPETVWSHVLSNPRFGYIATDAGTGHMWAENARENKLTPWVNDPLETRGGERIALRREGKEYSLFADRDGLACRVTYGFGYAKWVKTVGDAQFRVTAFVPPETNARVLLAETEGEGELAWFAELLLGPDRQMQPHVVTRAEEGAILAQNPYNTDFGHITFLFAATGGISSYTCDAESWSRGRLDGLTGRGLNPCLGAVLPFRKEIVLVTGCFETEEELERLRALTDPGAAKEALLRTREYWSGLTGALRVKTPEERLDRYLNGWAVYQAAACRLFARASVYQCGGAYGFRDQIQDACNLLLTAPNLCREQIFRAAAHQFEEGDVQHWWHPGTGAKDGSTGEKGVRTRISDDLLWLPYATCEYTEKTGDSTLLGETAPYLSSPPLRKEERERYDSPCVSSLKEPIYRHCVRALDRALERGTGAHGLALIGGGDWNDGFDRVGIEGRGESTWLTWFLVHVLERFAPLCREQGEADRAEGYEKAAESLAEAGNRAWDGEWFLRGYYDSGEPLGSGADRECKIDSIAQSFAALVRGADREKTETGIESAARLLTDETHGLIKLFSPPFDGGGGNPGYIRGYPPGVRENGGQYTHAAVWLAMGCLLSGMEEAGERLLTMLLPSEREEAYKAEPYVLAADVYSKGDRAGRAGWTWYTGAAAWYFRVAAEYLLGLRLRNGALTVRPSLPGHWDGFSAVWKSGEAEFVITAERGEEKGLFLDGRRVAELRPEEHPGKHEVRAVF